MSVYFDFLSLPILLLRIFILHKRRIRDYDFRIMSVKSVYFPFSHAGFYKEDQNPIPDRSHKLRYFQLSFILSLN